MPLKNSPLVCIDTANCEIGWQEGILMGCMGIFCIDKWLDSGAQLLVHKAIITPPTSQELLQTTWYN